MANISQLKKSAPYTVTAADVIAGGVEIQITWESPFYDTHYAVTYTIELAASGAGVRADIAAAAYFPVAVQSLTPTGFRATVGNSSPLAGDVLIIHASGSHK